MRHKWTNSDLRKIQAAADAGQTRQQVADELGLPVSHIGYACSNYGIRFTDRRRRRDNVPVWDRSASAWSDR